MRGYFIVAFVLLSAPDAGAGILSPPVLLGSAPTPSSAFDVVLAGNYALVPAYDAGVQIIDVSNPESPFVAGVYETPGFAVQCVRAGNRAIVADHSAGAKILGIANPAAPSLLGSFAATDAILGVAANGGIMLTGYLNGGFDVIDATNAAQPAVVASVATTGTPRHALFHGDHLFVADHAFGVRAYDVSNLAAPVQEWESSLNRPTGLDAAGSLLFASDYDGLHVYHVTSPEVLGFVALPGPAIKLQVVDGVAFVADHVAGGLQVVDVSDPSQPAVITGYPTGYYAHGIAVAAPFAYLADGEGLQVFRVMEAPVGVEKKTIGGVKALFRNGGTDTPRN